MKLYDIPEVGKIKLASIYQYVAKNPSGEILVFEKAPEFDGTVWTCGNKTGLEIGHGEKFDDYLAEFAVMPLLKYEISERNNI